MWPSSWPHGPPQPSPLQPHQLASSPMQLASLSKSTVAFVVPYQLGPPPTQLLLYTLPSYPLALPRFQIQLTPSPTSTPFHHPIILLYCLSLPLLTLINKRSYMQHVEDIVHLSVSRPICKAVAHSSIPAKEAPSLFPPAAWPRPRHVMGCLLLFSLRARVCGLEWGGMLTSLGTFASWSWCYTSRTGWGGVHFLQIGRKVRKCRSLPPALPLHM